MFSDFSKPFPNIAYCCKLNICFRHLNQLVASKDTSESQLISKKLESTVTKLTKQYLSTEHIVLQKAISDLSNKIDSLQTQESKLSEQIKSTLVALGKYPVSSAQPVSNRKSNVVVYGVDKNPPKTPRNVQLQKDIKTMLQIFNSINVHVDPTHILDCFRLGKFKSQQTRPRPILVKLQHSTDANADMTASERAIKSALLKQRWLITEAGYDRKQIKFSNNRIYVSGKIFGQVTNVSSIVLKTIRFIHHNLFSIKILLQLNLPQWINSIHLILFSQQMFIHSLPDNLMKLNKSKYIFKAKFIILQV